MIVLKFEIKSLSFICLLLNQAVLLFIVGSPGFFLWGLFIFLLDSAMIFEFNFKFDKIYVQSYFLGFKMSQKKLSKNQAIKIERKKSYFHQQSTALSKKQDAIYESIVIWFGTDPYTLKNLTKAQADRIGSELSNWFNLPIDLIL